MGGAGSAALALVGAMLGLGTRLFALFVTWVATAQAIYVRRSVTRRPPEFRILPARADDAAGMVADRGRLWRRFPVRRIWRCASAVVSFH